jgi:hypothetical protein
MDSKKPTSTPERAPAASTTDNTHSSGNEIPTVLHHLLSGLSINTDQADSEYGIKHLHSVIPKIERFIRVDRSDINRPHPITNIVRPIANYRIDDHLIKAYTSAEGREKLRSQQTTANIAKSRSNDNKVLIRMCCYCKRETMEAKLHEIYGQLAANDDN